MSRAQAIAVLGCSSDAGKSLVATALCRWFRRRSIDVVPFKAQNMSNNARVVDGGEIGVAQWLQAHAAGVEPDVRMNPVLVKPEADTRSQVVVRGRADLAVSAMAWDDRHELLWDAMASSYDELAAEHELVIIEGAGSPAEINLRDQVNNRIVEHAGARALLVADIDRGGAFAHLYGTWALVPDETRRRLGGFVLNKFRGDAALLAPGPERICALTGMAALGTLPMLDHGLPAEEGARAGAGVGDGARVAIPRLPFGSNLDEFHLVATVSHVDWASDPAAFDRLDPARDLIVLPGSKHVLADLTWLRDRGIGLAIERAARQGVRIVGVCGGAMMLGGEIEDVTGIEGGRPQRGSGLGLIDLRTALGHEKVVARRTVVFDAAPAPFEAMPRTAVEGYEIRFGRLRGDATPVARAGAHPVAWIAGNVMATTVHGIFEDPDVVRALVGTRPSAVLDATFEQLADAIDEHLDISPLSAALRLGAAD